MAFAMSSTAFVASASFAEHRDDGRRGQLGGDESQGHLGDDAQRPFGADEELRQRQTCDVLEPGPTEIYGPPIGEHHRHAQHIVRGHAVFHAAQTAGVRGDVAADRAELEGRGVRRVPQAVFGGGGLHLGVEGTRLDDGHARDRIDADLAHLIQGEHDSAGDRGAASGQSGTGAAGHDRHLRLGGDAHDLLHLLGGGHSDDGQRYAGIRIVRSIPAVGVHRVGIGDDGRGRQG